MAEDVLLSQITLDPGVSQRVNGTIAARVSEYATAMKDGAVFPPVVVFFDGHVHWLADGFHRCEAAEKVGLKAIAANVREGERNDAVVYATSANSDHGARRTNADKRKSVATLLTIPDWEGKSDRAIARHVGCTQPFVSKLRKLPPEQREKPTATPKSQASGSAGLARAWSKASEEERVEWLRRAGPEVLKTLQPYAKHATQYSLWDE